MNDTDLHNELVHLRAAARWNPSSDAYVKLAENQLCLGVMEKAVRLLCMFLSACFCSLPLQLSLL